MMWRFVLWGIRLGTAALVAGILYGLATLAWHVAGYVDVDPIARQDLPQVAQTSDQRIDTAAITSWSPFGKAPPSVSTLKQASTAISALSLLAVRVTEPEISSTATISISGAAARIYTQGDAIGQGITLARVAAQHVILDVDGTRQTLGFPVPPASSGTGATAQLASMQRVTPANMPVAEPAEDTIDRYRKAIAANPQTVLKSFALSPTPEGYLVGDNAPEAVVRAGLKPGDRVVAVNGNTVGNVDLDIARFESVIASGRARIELLRDGKSIILTFPLK